MTTIDLSSLLSSLRRTRLLARRWPVTPWALALVLVLVACSTAPIPAPPAAPPATAPASAPPSAPATAPEEVAAEATPDSAPASPFPLDEPLPIDPSMVRGRLDNGLSYFLKANGRPEARAELRLVVDAGSMQEDESQLGLAHFVEHMAFNGTERFAKQELVDYLQSIGMRFGADVNAYTSFDETVYMLTVPTDDDEILEKAFLILEEWASGVAFEPEEVEAERGVVIEEWRLGLGAGARIQDQQFPVLFSGSRYAERLPIGKKEILETAPVEELVRFYRDWYRPDLMAVIAVGDFDPERIEGLIHEHFGDLEGPAEPRPKQLYPVPPHEETMVNIATDPELTRTSVTVYYKHPRPPEGSYGDYRRSLVEGLADSMLNARLAELRRRPEAPFLFAASQSGGLVRTAAAYFQVAGVEQGGVERGLAALLDEVARVERFGFTATELERAKKDLLRGYQTAYDERDKLESGGFASEYTRHFLEAEPVPGIELEVAMARAFLPEISLDEVNRLASEWIRDENRVILVSGPEKDRATLPQAEALVALFDEGDERELTAYQDRVLEGPLVAEPPTPGSIVAESEVPEVGLVEWRLSNGARVLLKPTDFKNDEILFTGFSPGGLSLVPDDELGSGLFATAVVREGGLGAFDPVSLSKALAGTEAGASPFIDELEEGLNAASSRDDLETMFQLIYLTATAPRRDHEAVESWRGRVRTFVENRSARPEAVFSDRMGEVLTQGHPRYRPLSVDLVESIDVDTAFRIYRDRFADFGDFTFILVGSFSPDEVRPWVETYLASLPSSGREESWVDHDMRPPEGIEKVEVRRGLEPKSLVSLSFGGPAEWSRENLHRILTLESTLRMRMREVLREDKGGTYGVSIDASLSPRPEGSYSISIGFGCAPENVDDLVAAVFAEIEALRENGPSPVHLANTKEAQLRKRQTDVEQNAFWLSVLRSYVSLGLDPRLILEYEELVDGVSAESLQAAAREYLDPDRYVLGVLSPAEDVAATAADEPPAAEETGDGAV